MYYYLTLILLSTFYIMSDKFYLILKLFDDIFFSLSIKQRCIYLSLTHYRQILFLFGHNRNIFDRHFGYLLSKNGKIKLAKNIIDNNINALNDMYKNASYLHIDNFVIFGCPESHDIDIAIITSNINDLSKRIDLTVLKNQLNDLGYDIVNRKIDTNIVQVVNNNFVNAFKGGKEIQNIIFLTYDYHKQKYQNPFKNCIANEPFVVNGKRKVNVISKFIVDHLKSLISKEKYALERNIRKIIYSSPEERLIYSLKIINEIKIIDSIDFKDVFKSLTMKIIQLHLLKTNRFEYTKYKLAELYAQDHNLNIETLLWFLFRGTRGFYSIETMKTLIDTFINISNSLTFESLVWCKIDLKISNTFDFPNDIFDEFVKSPLVATDLFCQLFDTFCPDH